MTTEKMNEILLGSAKSSPNAKNTFQSERSDLARIDIKSEDPFDLFKEWHEDARKYSTGSPDALCLATVSKDLKVSARHLLLRHYDERGFIVVTDNRSRKCKELAEVPSAAMCILWAYINDRQEKINRQVRIEGKIEQLSCEEFRHLYDREPLYCKIRSHLCCQDEEIDWEEQKIRHDKLVNEVNAGNKNLPMPDHFVAYRLTPETMEYYFAHDHLIADRLLFTRESAVWTHRRIAA